MWNGTSVSATITGGVCTVTYTNTYSAGDTVVMTGTATTGTFAGVHQLTGATGSNFTFSTSATGTVTSPVITFWFNGQLGSSSQNIATKIGSVVHTSAGNYTITFVNTQSTAFYGISLCSTYTANTNSAPTKTGFVADFSNQDQSYFSIFLTGIT
jgi:hypothetical protein